MVQTSLLALIAVLVRTKWIDIMHQIFYLALVDSGVAQPNIL